jgi:hypothetical protein
MVVGDDDGRRRHADGFAEHFARMGEAGVEDALGDGFRRPPQAYFWSSSSTQKTSWSSRAVSVFSRSSTCAGSRTSGSGFARSPVARRPSSSAARSSSA